MDFRPKKIFQVFLCVLGGLARNPSASDRRKYPGKTYFSQRRQERKEIQRKCAA
jgi:hypothetical protein